MYLKARSVVAKAIWQGYYWLTMHHDAREEKFPKTLMTLIMAPWVFFQWGMDVLGPLPEAPRKVKYVIVAKDYFTKWIKAKPLAKTTKKEVKKFVWDNIVCRFGLPRITVTENETNFVNDPFESCLMKGIKKQLGRERKGWVDELPNVLWDHQMSLKTSNRETPYNIICGSEAVFLVEIGMPTHQTIMIKEGIGNEEEIRLNLYLLHERREAEAIREARCKLKMEHYYNKRV
ncbi:reverse transcriptase domain-containing protein [Tanacetum coccineum]